MAYSCLANQAVVAYVQSYNKVRAVPTGIVTSTSFAQCGTAMFLATFPRHRLRCCGMILCFLARWILAVAACRFARCRAFFFVSAVDIEVLQLVDPHRPPSSLPPLFLSVA